MNCTTCGIQLPWSMGPSRCDRCRAALDAQQTANTAETPRVIALHRALPMSGPFGLADAYNAMRRLAETLEREGNQLRALGAPQEQQPSTTAAEVRALVDEYLGAGGLFNPEMMEHEKVRDLIIRMRDMIAPLDAPQTTKAIDPDNSRCAIPPAQTDPREAFEKVAKDYNLDLTRLGDRYASVETQMRWRWFGAGFAAGRGR